MAERLHELWWRDGFQEALDTFRGGENFIAIQIGGRTNVIFSTDDGEPYHAKIRTIDLETSGEEEETTMADLINLYRVAETAAPHNKLTRVLKGVVLERIRDARAELSIQLESAHLLEKRIIATDGRVEISQGHP